METLRDNTTNELRVDLLTGKTFRLQHAKKLLEAELREAKILHQSLEKELASLEAESSHLEEEFKKREDVLRMAKLQYEEAEVDSNRLPPLDGDVSEHEINKKHEEVLENYKSEIQAVAQVHRKHRLKFESQVMQAAEQHKTLHSLFAPERLPDELSRSENVRNQLLAKEKCKLEQLAQLEEEIKTWVENPSS